MVVEDFTTIVQFSATRFALVIVSDLSTVANKLPYKNETNNIIKNANFISRTAGFILIILSSMSVRQILKF